HISPRLPHRAQPDQLDRLARVTFMLSGHERLISLSPQHKPIGQAIKILNSPIGPLARLLVDAKIRPPHVHALRSALDNFDKRVFLHPPELVEQLGPTVVALEELKARAAAVRELEEWAITGLMPEHEPLRPALP